MENKIPLIINKTERIDIHGEILWRKKKEVIKLQLESIDIKRPYQ